MTKYKIRHLAKSDNEVRDALVITLLVALLGVFVAVTVLTRDDADAGPRPAAAATAPAETSTTTVPPPVTEAPVQVSSTVVERPAPAKPVTKAPVTTSKPSTAEAPAPPLSTPERVLAVAAGEVGKAGPYTDGGFWCAKFTNWVAEQAKVSGWQSTDSPARQFGLAMEDGRVVAFPQPGDLIFVDLMGSDGTRGGISHVGIVEEIAGDVFTTIEGNADASGTVTRQTRQLEDGYVVGFAAMGAE